MKYWFLTLLTRLTFHQFVSQNSFSQTHVNFSQGSPTSLLIFITHNDLSIHRPWFNRRVAHPSTTSQHWLLYNPIERIPTTRTFHSRAVTQVSQRMDRSEGQASSIWKIVYTFCLIVWIIQTIAIGHGQKRMLRLDMVVWWSLIGKSRIQNTSQWARLLISFYKTARKVVA
jgi:hypothetical protein